MKRAGIMRVAAALMLAALATPALAAPEVWLSQRGGPWSKDEITFNLRCSSTYAVSHDGHTFDYDNPIDNIPVTDTSGPTPTWNAPGGYPASTFILVEARNVEGNYRDQEELPEDHKGRAWGKTMWCQLWNGCTIEEDKEIDIRLTITTSPPASPAFDLLDHGSSASGKGPIEVTRGARTVLRKKVVSLSRLCDTANQNVMVTIKGEKLRERELPRP